MYKIELINTLIKRYKLWTIKLNSNSVDIKNNILQNDQSSKVEEKIMSIGISMLFVYIVTGIIGLFGVATGGFIAGVILFIIGWLLSKVVNKFVFGTPRTIESLSDDEKEIFATLEYINSVHKSIRDRINTKNIVVNFCDYALLKNEFNTTITTLQNYSTRKLALKYKMKHPLMVQKYKQQIKVFDAIYANKR